MREFAAAAAAAAPRGDARPAAARGCRASGRWPAPCACSTSASSGSAARTTPRTNESYGLATVRREHVSIERRRGRLRLPGQERPAPGAVDPRPARSGGRSKRCAGGAAAPRTCSPGARTASWRDVRSDDVNAYIQEKIGEGFSAKDFRTWHGTVLAAVELAGERAAGLRGGRQAGDPRGGRAGRRALGNTPAVCRRSYIDPRVLDRFRDGETIELAPRLRRGRADASGGRGIERRVLDLIG